MKNPESIQPVILTKKEQWKPDKEHFILARTDELIRDKIFEKYKVLVEKMVRRHKVMNPSFDKEDLYQEGCIGLMKAIQKFNPEKYENTFEPYAEKYIGGYIKNFVSKNVTALTVGTKK